MSQPKPNSTTASFANAILPDNERRAEDRVHTVFRVARIIGADDEGLARIKNMSDSGAGIRMSIPADLSDTVTIELVDGVELRGHVVWRNDHEFGLNFERPISAVDLLAALAVGTQSGLTRPVRLRVAATALTRSERGVRSVRVVDISQRGLKLLHDGSLTAGLDLKVTLPCGLDRQGIVRWTRDNHAGVMLLEPLSVEALGSARSLVTPCVSMIVSGGLDEPAAQP
ncbi:MAG: PilZ domain-containing protein [Sphingomonadales bacterium]|nr:PilZ domain-containing protein [Sphingomonadales bacterium]NCQ20710.1 PilZ domain-containing protein [Sphingomonadales bacterium]NCT03708.1 PilZ domain-containing protein [Sphingomonadales bacterium]